ncbi:hypothetical protein QQS21_003142 [Conoideocrella luteorostrata]|uniref:C2H2-type domain-containing protein n=1 Tax=Conoideocrella luteorostrata TaxID=1105319 RepID=A0AAJ0CTT4_9HYPO|nr:hypothetical protein QQS21_003142 [Conoideocrella luteorostrata]
MERLCTLADEFASWDSLKPNDRAYFESSNYNNVQQDIGTIQAQQEIAKTLMNMNRIEHFLTRMAHFEEILLVLDFEHTPRVMAYVWGPIRFLILTTNLTEKALDYVLDVYEQLGNAMPPLHMYVQLFTSLPETGECLACIYEHIGSFHRLAYKLFSVRTHLWQRLYKATWKSSGEIFRHLSDCLSRHEKFMASHAYPFQEQYLMLDMGRSADPLSVAQYHDTTKQELSSHLRGLELCLENFKEEEASRKAANKKDVISWLSASTRTMSTHRELQSMRICPNSCRWLFKRYNEVRDWMTEEKIPESALWLHGSRGYGKSVLVSALVDELKKYSKNNEHNLPPNSKVYFFYCQEDDAESCTYLGILKGILRQMVDDNDDLIPLCVEKRASTGKANLESPEAAESLIDAFLEYNPRQYIIIDGPDQCNSSESIQTAQFFKKQIEKYDNETTRGRLRVLFMSQPMEEPAIVSTMPQDGACVQLKPLDNADDIRAFVKKRIPEFSQSRTTNSGFNLSEGDKFQIERIICHLSKDMFLFAHLAIEFLLQQPTKEKLKEKIEGEMLPKELSQMYEKIIGEIKNELLQLADGEAHWDMAKFLLSWLVCAKRPLKWHEMQAALSFDPNRQTVDFDNKMLRQNATKYLGSLVHVIDGDYIRIIHSTARIHVVKNEHINEGEVQCELAILCLRYLCLPCFSKYEDDEHDRMNMARLGWFSFQDYACSQWRGHVADIISKRGSFFSGSDYERRIAYALKCFVEKYDASLASEFHADFEQERAELSEFSGLSFYNDLISLWNHIVVTEKSTYDNRNKTGIEELDEVLQENRKLIEDNFTPTSAACLEDTIKDYYGPCLYKCKRTLCKSFYLGFERKKDRDVHHNRHDRPFPCLLPDCRSAPIGFSSSKDQLRHMRKNHPDKYDGLCAFEPLNPVVNSTKFQCEICKQNFTRNINLKGHMRSHFGDRPYVCSHAHCDKSFARLNDLRRHERNRSRFHR